MKDTRTGPLPFMKTMDDAMAVCRREKDNFYLTAFVLEMWLGEVTCSTVAQYAERKSPKSRKLQQGLSAHSFANLFGHVSDAEYNHLFQSILRFAEFDDPQSRTLARAFWISSLESPTSTWPAPVPPLDAGQFADGVAFMRRFVHRLGEWVEAITHARIHLMSYQVPLAFDPDPEKRELALLGYRHRSFPEMTDFTKSWWQWHHHEASERLSDPSKWTMVGAGMADATTRHQNYPALDDCIIMLWPLVRRHGWTYLDLMNVIRSISPVPLRHPCEREQGFASHCNNVLGLNKQSRGRTHPDGTSPGFEVARAMTRRESPPEFS